MLDIDDAHIGRRVREVRTWRGLSVTAAAGLAGISQSYLSRIEAGERPVTKRSLLEALAQALRVSPAELTGKPWEFGVAVGDDAQAGMAVVAATLDACELGEDPGVPTREWVEVAADMKRLVDAMQIRGDYVVQGEVAPRLLPELHALYVHAPDRRRDVLLALIRCYASVATITKLHRSEGLTLLAGKAAQQCAETLGSPQWRGYTVWMRGVTAGALNRRVQYRRTVAMADELTPALDDPEVNQAFGQLHLSAALAAAVQNDRDTAVAHLTEADAAATRLDTDPGTFATVWFGRTNVAIWRTLIGLELGEGAKVAEYARDVRVDHVPSPQRQAVFYSNLGRALLGEARTRDQGMAALLRAEQIAPQVVRGDVFVREAVSDQLRAARRTAGGRELRSLAYRMGVAPTA